MLRLSEGMSTSVAPALRVTLDNPQELKIEYRRANLLAVSPQLYVTCEKLMSDCQLT